MANTNSKPNSSRLVFWLGPVALVLLIYNYNYHWSVQRDLTSSRARLEKQQLEAIGEQERAAVLGRAVDLRNDIDQHDEQLRKLVSQRLALAGQARVNPVEPTEIVARLAQWCEQHDLTVDSHSTESTQGVGPATDRLKRLANLPAGHDFSPWLGPGPDDAVPVTSVAPSPAATVPGRVCRLHVRGTYQHMQQALDELESLQLPVWPIAVEMTSENLRQPVKQWVVTLWF